MPKPLRKKTNRKRQRRVPGRQRELELFASGAVVAGVDEVGRGAWAGPVVAAAVVLDPAYRIRKAYDSKQMTALERERCAARIRNHSLAVGVGEADLAEVNRYGLTWAIQAAGHRAVEALGQPITQVLLDGNHNYFSEDYSCETIIKGDSKELCIAAASIVAKVHRDGLMIELDQAHPGYHFAEHKGYGTPNHRAAIRQHGVSPAHRTRWAPIMAELQLALPL